MLIWNKTMKMKMMVDADDFFLLKTKKEKTMKSPTQYLPVQYGWQLKQLPGKNGKKGLKFSQIVLVRLEGGDPPPQSGQPDRFFTVFLPLPLGA